VAWGSPGAGGQEIWGLEKLLGYTNVKLVTLHESVSAIACAGTDIVFANRHELAAC
jgi:hypothetical protein